MPGQPNRDYPDRCAPVLSCHRPYCGELRSLCSQPLETDFIGSALTCASWTRAHLMHLTVQCSKPVRAAVMRLISARDWPFGNEAAQGDRVCGSGNDASRGVRRKRRQIHSVADGCRWPGGDRGSMPTWHYDSMVLLTLRDLTLPPTIVAGGTLAGIGHWLSWRWPMPHYYFDIKDGHLSRWICVAAICLGLAPKAEAGERSGLVDRASCTVV